MRRSKSDCSKYAKNYRSISQRRMTEQDADFDEEKEMQRLRSILHNTETQLQKYDDADDETIVIGRKRGRPDEPQSPVDQIRGRESEKLGTSLGGLTEDENPVYGAESENPLILPPRKKKEKTGPKVQLSPQEIRKAKLLQKNTNRKLKQLTTRVEQKKRRDELYGKLEASSISAEEMQLLSSSATLGKRLSKRETLQRLLRKERAGLVLTEEERNLLYTERTLPDDVDDELTKHQPPPTNEVLIPEAKKGKEKKSKAKNTEMMTVDDDEPMPDKERNSIAATEKLDNHLSSNGRKELPDSAMTKESKPSRDESTLPKDGESKPTITDTPPSKPNFAAQMMASLSILRAQTGSKQEQNEPNSGPTSFETNETTKKDIPQVKAYVPSNPVVLKTAAALGLAKDAPVSDHRKILEIQRPADVKESRNDLPVCGMEFEIMDAIRNNDVTIICGETGSGKSTQVPQFLYEAGFAENTAGIESQKFLIGVTQPRRVAAVSTAKRVCYEMGFGNGQKIGNGSKNGGNAVAYQTRYETAGLGSDTRVKFMTDGILLQEIQSDFLLRQYSVIILDEAHERNLNTDVLLGLLSVALPLRQEAAMEVGSGLVPLKLIIMSATLRVEDFTSNDVLFPRTKPVVVKVPGRTFPVTIHHSKVTELEKYEDEAFSKVCKIHRKLPQGGILVFLTGKQEIERMVQRLRKVLNRESRRPTNSLKEMHDNAPSFNPSDDNFPRDLDDEEVDGDIFQPGDPDTPDIEWDDDLDMIEKDEPGEADNQGIPSKAHVLPLYSMLSSGEQAKVFACVPEGHRLIVIATNVAETSITIPGICYVVDSGRQKCRTYNAGTGVASYCVTWISKAAADQRAGRAGRTGPGHCYRLYSSSMYARHMEPFSKPEVLTMPLEDVVLSLKALKVENVGLFPFPTRPERSQLDAAVKLLANLGCVDIANVEKEGGDGEITRLGMAVAKLPVGVRYGKMLLVSAQAGVLDYAIAMVAALSEASPFLLPAERKEQENGDNDGNSDFDSLDGVDRSASDEAESKRLMENFKKWSHKAGDVMAALLAIGGYSFAGQGTSPTITNASRLRFCEDNGLNPVVMERIQKMRAHLARLVQLRIRNADCVAARTGGVLKSMPPPNKVQEALLCQAVASGLLDNVAMLAPPGSISGEHEYSLRSAYVGCSTSLLEPLFLDRNSVVYSNDWRLLPRWVCYDSLIRKTTNKGGEITLMKTVTPIDVEWLGKLAKGSRLLRLGEPLQIPLPTYDANKDAIMCSVTTKYGIHGWEIPPVQMEMFPLDHNPKCSAVFMVDDSFRWFARYLLEGKVFPDLGGLHHLLNDDPSLITRKSPSGKVALLVSALSAVGINSASALRQHWANVNDKFLFKHLKSWTKPENTTEAKQIWIEAVKRQIGNAKGEL